MGSVFLFFFQVLRALVKRAKNHRLLLPLQEKPQQLKSEEKLSFISQCRIWEILPIPYPLFASKPAIEANGTTALSGTGGKLRLKEIWRLYEAAQLGRLDSESLFVLIAALWRYY